MGRVSYIERIPYLSPEYMKADEHHHQVAYFEKLKKENPLLRNLTFAIPNGGSRNMVEAVNLKLEGVSPGVPDVFQAVPSGIYHGLFLEFKNMDKKSRPSDEQVRRINDLRGCGYIAVVVHGWAQAWEAQELYQSMNYQPNGFNPFMAGVTRKGINYRAQLDGNYGYEYWLSN